MTIATCTPPTAAAQPTPAPAGEPFPPVDRAAEFVARLNDYFKTIARKALEHATDRQDYPLQRVGEKLRDLAELLGRDWRVDLAAAHTLIAFKNKRSAVLPAADLTAQELLELEREATAARTVRDDAAQEAIDWRRNRQSDRRSKVKSGDAGTAYDAASREGVRFREEAAGAARAAVTKIQDAIDLAKDTPAARATAMKFPELAAALGLTLEVPARRTRAKTN